LTELAKKKRRVLVGSPSYDGKLDVWYVNSLIQTVKIAERRGDIEIIPIWVSFDALIQRCRNDIVEIALSQGCDDLIWIDTDIEWEPEWFFKLLDYPFDVVGGTYPKKGDKEQYVVSLGDYPGIINSDGLIQVTGLGTGFLKFSKKACQWLWDNSVPYNEPEKDNLHKRWIFDVVVQGADLISEDIWVCRRLTNEGGFPVYLDPTITCSHVGGKKYKGNFLEWFKNKYRKSQSLSQESKTSSGISYLNKYLK
jgi:hypothetical protein